MNQPALDISGLSLTLDKKRILDEVTFQVQHGERLTIIGPNGAGKTTLLRCLAGLRAPGSGAILIEGRPLASYPHRELARHVSYVPQAEGRLLPYTAFEFVLMARYPHLGPLSGVTREDKEAAWQALKTTETEGFAERTLDTLSGGERQKVFVAAALAQGAHILLLDEPMTFLDYRHQVEVLSLIRQLAAEEEKTVLCVTHDLNRGVFDSDRVLALHEGQVVFFGSPDELFTPNRLQEIYGTPFDLITHQRSGHTLVIPLAPGTQTELEA